MESLTRRGTQLAIFLAFMFLFFVSLNLSLTINSALYDNEGINSHLRKLLARPPRAVNQPPTPMSNPNKHFEVPPGPPPPPQDDGTR
ncbi:hypothetical protein MKW92_010117 [Papaver armeniacum]|nr:hypothetical protein MKW92_010117 [Papaver armeniacum]